MARNELYDDEGEVQRESCPRCGDTFLADHGDRLHCGKCGYTELET
jgi:small subunit ribosomal protein S27Ae